MKIERITPLKINNVSCIEFLALTYFLVNHIKYISATVSSASELYFRKIYEFTGNIPAKK